jgi:hypothetical protein
MLHCKFLIWVNTVVLIHHLVQTSVEAIVLKSLILLVLVVLVNVSTHYRWIIIIEDIFLEWCRSATLDFRSFYFFGIIGAIATVSCTTSHFF